MGHFATPCFLETRSKPGTRRLLLSLASTRVIEIILRRWWLYYPGMNEPEKITREELYERIWKLPATRLARELGISDVAVTKLCRKLNVPKPGPGHWRLIQLGWEIERPALPALEEGPAAATTDPEPQRAAKAAETPTAPPAPAAPEAVLGPEEAAERGVLDIIRQATRINFWWESISREEYLGGLPGWLEVKAGEKTLERALSCVFPFPRRENPPWPTQLSGKPSPESPFT